MICAVSTWLGLGGFAAFFLLFVGATGVVVCRAAPWHRCTFCEGRTMSEDSGGGVRCCEDCELLGAPIVVDWAAGDTGAGGWCDDCGEWFDPGAPGGFSDCDGVGRVWSVHEQVVSGVCAPWQCCTVCRLARWRRASVEDRRPVEGVIG